jgi:hypothetical protein
MIDAPYIEVQQAQTPDCGPLEKYLADYKARFGETPFWSGVSTDQKTRTIFLVNPNSGTWTVAIARIVDGSTIACTAAGGTDFMPIPTERHMRAPNKQADGT